MNGVNSPNDDIYSKYTKDFLDYEVTVQSIIKNKYNTMTIRRILSGIHAPTECSAHLCRQNYFRYVLEKAIGEYPTPFKKQQ